MFEPGDVVVFEKLEYVVKSRALSGLNCVPVDMPTNYFLLKEEKVILGQKKFIVGPLSRPTSVKGMVSILKNNQHFAVVLREENIRELISELQVPIESKMDTRSLAQILYTSRHRDSSYRVLMNKLKTDLNIWTSVGSVFYSPILQKLDHGGPKIRGAIYMDVPSADPLRTLTNVADSETLIISDHKEWTFRHPKPVILSPLQQPVATSYKRIILDSTNGALLNHLQYKELIVYTLDLSEQNIRTILSYFKFENLSTSGVNQLFQQLVVKSETLPPYIKREFIEPSQIEIDNQFRRSTHIVDVHKKFDECMKAGGSHEPWIKYLPRPQETAFVEDKCAICLELLSDSFAQTTCGHTFHWHCIVRVLLIVPPKDDEEVDPRPKLCPKCRKRINYTDLWNPQGPEGPVLSGIGVAFKKCDTVSQPQLRSPQRFQSVLALGPEENGIKTALLSTQSMVKMWMSKGE